MTRTTLKDVAAKAGVSYQTVSKVLNGQIQVTEETETRIWQTITDLGYRPNVSARNLRTQASNLIGHALPGDAAQAYHPILVQFMISVANATERLGYHLLSFGTGTHDFYGHQVYDQLYARNQVAGFILSNTTQNDPRIPYLMERGIPFCSFGRANDAWDFCWVDVDGQHGIELAASHLLSQGHQRIGFVTWPEGSQTGWHREQGYLLTLQAAGIEVDPQWIARGDNSAQVGAQGMNQLLALPAAARPTAVICVSDLMAIGAMNAAAAAGLIVGQDIAITGFDDIPMAEYLHTPLTSVRQPIQEIGRYVIDLITKQIRDEPIEQKGVLFKPRLVIRASSQR